MEKVDRIRKVTYTIMVIIKDIAKMTICCLALSILFCIAVEQGWILPEIRTDISYQMFWNLFRFTYIAVPITVVLKAFTGRYNEPVVMTIGLEPDGKATCKDKIRTSKVNSESSL